MADNRAMPRSSARRRLMTVLFLDIVDSTALAHDLGDAHWRVVLTNFRATVRHELKRRGGREQGTEGDSFFATFAEPVQALRAAAEIAAAVQDVGLDVRSGVHTGEVEEVDGTLGGIAVHIGARVTALAGPAEVMVTSTVKELVAGSGAVFDDGGRAPAQGRRGALAHPSAAVDRRRCAAAARARGRGRAHREPRSPAAPPSRLPGCRRCAHRRRSRDRRHPRGARRVDPCREDHPAPARPAHRPRRPNDPRSHARLPVRRQSLRRRRNALGAKRPQRKRHRRPRHDDRPNPAGDAGAGRFARRRGRIRIDLDPSQSRQARRRRRRSTSWSDATS